MSCLYNLIPSDLLKGNILDLGCGSGHGLFMVASNEDRYTGLDLEPIKSDLCILRADIRYLLDIGKRYDLILLIEVLEHIELKYWEYIFYRVKTLLKDRGTVIISVPYREPQDSGMTSPDDSCPHIVFNIDHSRFQKDFPLATISYHGVGSRRLLPFVRIMKPIWMMLTWKKEREQ